MIRITLFVLLMMSIRCTVQTNRSSRTDKISAQNPDMDLVDATFFTKKSNSRLVGDIYSFTLHTHIDGLQFKHIWFGTAYPVPLEVYDSETNAKPKTTKYKTIVVKGNRQLYTNFYPTVDSTKALFKKPPPVKCKGLAVITYELNGEEKYFQVLEARKLAKTGYR